MKRSERPNRLKERVLKVIAAIPEGRVTTYGAIARRVSASPRMVARVLASLSPDEADGLPWFRVVAANGIISSIKLGAVGRCQIARLQREQVTITARNRVSDFPAVFWPPE